MFMRVLLGVVSLGRYGQVDDFNLLRYWISLSLVHFKQSLPLFESYSRLFLIFFFPICLLSKEVEVPELKAKWEILANFCTKVNR